MTPAELTQRLAAVEEMLVDMAEAVATRPAGGLWLLARSDAPSPSGLLADLGQFVRLKGGGARSLRPSLHNGDIMASPLPERPLAVAT